MKHLCEIFRFVWRLDFLRMAALWPCTVVFSYLHILLLPWRPSRTSTTHPRCSPALATSIGPLCIITGPLSRATSGLGAAAAYELSKEGFYVVLVGRSFQLLSKTIREIKSKNADARIKAFQVDMSLFLSISEFKESLVQWLINAGMHSSVQLLINNAGILATSPRLTAEGYDEMMATNYVGAFFLTKLLLPLLENSPTPSRIVNVMSFTHRTASNVPFNKDDVSGKSYSRSRSYPCAHIYEYSKLCLVLFTYELHRRLGSKEESEHVSAIAADPGVVETKIMREVPAFLSRFSFLAFKLLGLLRQPENGVASIVDAALAPPEISGVYFFGGKGGTINSSQLSYNEKLARDLWAASSDLVLQSQLAMK